MKGYTKLKSGYTIELSTSQEFLRYASAQSCLDTGFEINFLAVTLHLKIKKLSTNSSGDFDSVLDTMNHY